jgi:hypothetical protein
LELFALLLALSLLFIPRENYPWLVALVAPITGWLLWELNRPFSYADDWAPLGRLLGTSLMLFFGACALLRWLVGLWLNRRGDLPQIDWTPGIAGIAVTLLAGAGWAFGPLAAHAIGGWTLIFLTGAIAVALLVMGWRWQDRRRWIAGASGLTLIAGIASILSWPGTVARAAMISAGDLPYCIMIGDGEGDYRPARTLLDLSPLLMRATETPYLRNQHALLVMSQGAAPHFSYGRQRFEVGNEGADYINNPICKPRIDFVGSLPLG